VNLSEAQIMNIYYTSEAQIAESFCAPLEMVINFEALVILGQCPEFTKEGEILSWILREDKSVGLLFSKRRVPFAHVVRP